MAQHANAEATAANQLNSPLLRLPAELRNLIYHYALGNCTLIVSTFNHRLCLYQRDIPAFPLLVVCTQIHAEAAILPYSLNTFNIAFDHSLDMFITTMPLAYRHAIKRLDIGTWTVVDVPKETVCACLQRLRGLEEVIFNYHARRHWMFKGECEEAWEKVVKLLRERVPEVRTSVRDLDDEVHHREDALELDGWRFR